ncbi:TetR/AcrR family transcriptional regulator, partial [Glutamicibacter ardleyensis]|uniref:TetR/AcrR family transcriptional regulator n=1 Tax=Glutamicibacter ardleyensis TaxID=225894 RepID=UPI003FD37CAE
MQLPVLSRLPLQPGSAHACKKTRLSITQHARELTAEHGFAGFTVDQLCAGVGISRRTFFN